MGWREVVATLLGVSAYTAAPSTAPSLGSPQVDRAREAWGGQLQPPTYSQTRWYLSDLEAAEHAADGGHMAQAARLMRAASKDGVLAGVMSTRTSGLVRLPKRFRGRADIVAALELGHESTRSTFDEMFPPTELALLAADGVKIGVGVGELVPVEGRDFPVFVRLDPEFLEFRWTENRWYFRSAAGLIPITPGDGRWILHTPGGRSAPWQHGLWRALGKSYIRKEHASLYKDNWESKLANPARVAYAPLGTTEAQREGFFARLMAWGVNTVFALLPGWDVKLIESNGRGHESFDKTIAQSDSEFVIAIAGQSVTTDGGTGFSNADIHKSIRADLIKETADALAFTINTQGLPMFIVERWGEEALEDGCVVEWDVTPPKDRNSEATAMVTVASAIKTLTEALAPHGLAPDVEAICIRAGVPTRAVIAQLGEATAANDDVGEVAKVIELARGAGLQPTAESLASLASRVGLQLEEIPKGTEAPKRLDLAPTDLAKVVRAKEARGSQGLAPFGDERDEKTVAELGAEAAATPADAEPMQEAA